MTRATLPASLKGRGRRGSVHSDVGLKWRERLAVEGGGFVIDADRVVAGVCSISAASQEVSTTRAVRRKVRVIMGVVG